MPEYIDRAVAFANDTIWGTLNVTLLVHPASLRDPAVAEAVEQAVANLRYGTVAVNYWAGAGFVLGTTDLGRVSRPSALRYPLGHGRRP